MTTGVVPTLAAALFESASGFTTTGATVFATIEALPRSVLLWRSVSHWLGGMGIIVLGVAILPLLGVGGAQLFHAEAPGIATDRLKPRIASTARLLWVVYASMTAVLGVIYLALGMSVFDAANHAMSTLATGGFSTRSGSIGVYSHAIQWVTVAFMLLAGTNFTLHYRVMTGSPGAWLRDVEWRWFATCAAGGSLIAFLVLGLSSGDWSLESLRAATFSVVSVATTTGFVVSDFGVWPTVLQALLLGFMFVGAMGGSTGGGFKVVRFVVMTQHAVGEIRKVLHPRAVIVTRVGKTAVRPEALMNVMAFLALYVATHAVGTLVLTGLGSDLVTAGSAALAAMSSIGPGLGAVGPAAHYGDVGPAAHVTLTGLMLLGRLEFYTLLVLVLPDTWSRASTRG